MKVTEVKLLSIDPRVSRLTLWLSLLDSVFRTVSGLT